VVKLFVDLKKVFCVLMLVEPMVNQLIVGDRLHLAQVIVMLVLERNESVNQLAIVDFGQPAAQVLERVVFRQEDSQKRQLSRHVNWLVFFKSSHKEVELKRV